MSIEMAEIDVATMEWLTEEAERHLLEVYNLTTEEHELQVALLTSEYDPEAAAAYIAAVHTWHTGNRRTEVVNQVKDGLHSFEVEDDASYTLKVVQRDHFGIQVEGLQLKSEYPEIIDWIMQLPVWPAIHKNPKAIVNYIRLLEIIRSGRWMPALQACEAGKAHKGLLELSLADLMQLEVNDLRTGSALAAMENMLQMGKEYPPEVPIGSASFTAQKIIPFCQYKMENDNRRNLYYLGFDKEMRPVEVPREVQDNRFGSFRAMAPPVPPHCLWIMIYTNRCFAPMIQARFTGFLDELAVYGNKLRLDVIHHIIMLLSSRF